LGQIAIRDRDGCRFRVPSYQVSRIVLGEKPVAGCELLTCGTVRSIV
jgi:hypothetical protein